MLHMTTTEYLHITYLIINYLIINLSETRFSEHNEIALKLGAFILSEMVKIDKKLFTLILEEV